ncbi:uncharacterized protein LOC121324712 isoform X1 [Polyodon spathula]|uniref:uncharacterized protein LOC121324712 isoform X1 n=1 Tax=Polyodon spathula TaxID=7913 RepID=UPI001B7E6DA5|nr:uncharacterized protein LOC121324712 isoform X1 [Polyodon spathula]
MCVYIFRRICSRFSLFLIIRIALFYFIFKNIIHFATSVFHPESFRLATGLSDGKDARRSWESVERLAFKYMEKCKVESSTDSDSDTSPEGCASSTSESGAAKKGPVSRSSLPSLDPYDGCSEDSSDLSDCSLRSRQPVSSNPPRGVPSTEQESFPKDPGKCGAACVKLHAAGSKASPPADVHMRSSSDSETTASRSLKREPLWQRAVDSGILTESPLSTPGQCAYVSRTLARLPESPTYRARHSPPALDTMPKRKLGFPGPDTAERVHKKKQRVVTLEDTE